jgi:murein DD-endopeptidase MepM/ murein hydrolase activator NlpD
MHKGIDIANSVGTPIIAVQSGRVTFAGWNDGGYGYLVEITHDDGSRSLYAHQSRILVQVGEEVSQGQQVGKMGSTGRSTGPHLHFEIRPKGRSVDPLEWLRGKR